MESRETLSSYMIVRPTEAGWVDSQVTVAGRNDAEAAAMAADALPRGAAFKLRKLPGLYNAGDRFPAEPLDYNQRACATARMVNPAYLSWAELDLSIAASEADLGGVPF